MLADPAAPGNPGHCQPAEFTTEAEAWTALVAAGVPMRLPQPVAPRFDDPTVSAALAFVLDHGLADAGRERDALVAWLGALRDHFPSRFAVLAPVSPTRLQALRAAVDRGRYIKLRRIALAHLAVLI